MREGWFSWVAHSEGAGEASGLEKRPPIQTSMDKVIAAKPETRATQPQPETELRIVPPERWKGISASEELAVKEVWNETTGEWEEKQVSEDVALARTDIGVYGVFDGVGGLDRGEDASRTAQQMIAEVLANGPERLRELGLLEKYLREELKLPLTFLYSKDEIRSLLEEGLQKAHTAIRNFGVRKDAGTTASVAALYEGIDGKRELLGVNIGDSRIYVLKDGKLVRATEDDTNIQLMIKNRLLPADADQHIDLLIPEGISDRAQVHLPKDQRKRLTVEDMRNIITQGVGLQEQLKMHSIAMPVEKGDIIAAVTDGVSDNLLDDEIKENLRLEKSNVKAARATARTKYSDNPNPRAKEDDMAEVRVSVEKEIPLEDYLGSETRMEAALIRMRAMDDQELSKQVARLYSIRNQVEHVRERTLDGPEKEKLVMLYHHLTDMLAMTAEIQTGKQSSGDKGDDDTGIDKADTQAAA